MMTSKPSQPTLFEPGSEKPWQPDMYPTPVTHDAQMGYAHRVRRFPGVAGGRNLNDEVVGGVEPLTSSPEAIPASHSLSPGGAWARRMTATSGRPFAASLPTSALRGVFSRMFTDTSRWGSTMCYLTWKPLATPAGRSLFRLLPWVPRTGGIASGFLPTPAAQEPGIDATHLVDRDGNTPTHVNQRLYHRETGRVVQDGLTQYVQFFPTPTTSDGNGPGRHGDGAPDLRTFVSEEPEPRMWPTPRTEGFDAGRHRGKADSLHAAVKEAEGQDFWPTPTAHGLHNRSDASPKAGDGLSTAVKRSMIPTPTARDWKDGSSIENVPENGLLGRWAVNNPEPDFFPTPMPSDVLGGRTTKGKDRPDEHGIRKVVGGKLSAAWVSRLMGYPDGWMEDLPPDPLQGGSLARK